MARRLVVCASEKAGHQHIGINGRPDHFTPPGVMASSISPMRSDLGIHIGGRQRIEPAPLGARPGFLQPVGRRAAVRMKLCTPPKSQAV
jgi:hypothetical protein